MARACWRIAATGSAAAWSTSAVMVVILRGVSGGQPVTRLAALL